MCRRLGKIPDASRSDRSSGEAVTPMPDIARDRLTTHDPSQKYLEGGNRRSLILITLPETSTLRKYTARLLYLKGSRDKVSRRWVARIIALSDTVIRRNFGLTAPPKASATGLPSRA